MGINPRGKATNPPQNPPAHTVKKSCSGMIESRLGMARNLGL